MYRSFCPKSLGISGRQSELIELAMTHGFRGMDYDVGDLVKRSKLKGAEHTARFFSSAKIKISGFELPIEWRGTNEEYQAELAKLPEIIEIAKVLDAKACFTDVQPSSDAYPYHENFELHRKRLGEIGAILNQSEIRLGLVLQPLPSQRQGKRFEFIHQVEPFLMLLGSIGQPNVGVLIDSWTWHVGGGKLEHIRSLKAEQIVAVRLADLPASVDLTEITEEQRLLPGSGGGVDVGAIVNWLKEVNYPGPISVQPHPQQLAGKNRDAIVRACATALDALFEAAGLGGRTRIKCEV